MFFFISAKHLLNQNFCMDVFFNLNLINSLEYKILLPFIHYRKLMGVLARPQSTLAEIFRHSYLQSHLLTSPPTPQKSYLKFRNPRTTFENTPRCPPKYSIVREVHNFFQDVESSYFCYIGHHAKFRNPRITFEITPLFDPKMPQCGG